MRCSNVKVIFRGSQWPRMLVLSNISSARPWRRRASRPFLTRLSGPSFAHRRSRNPFGVADFSEENRSSLSETSFLTKIKRFLERKLWSENDRSFTLVTLVESRPTKTFLHVVNYDRSAKATKILTWASKNRTKISN